MAERIGPGGCDRGSGSWPGADPLRFPVRSTHKSPKVTFFGHFGTGNPGNESTLLTILSRLRALYPEGEFSCVCSYPETLTARVGIPAIPITTRALRIWDREIPLPRRLLMTFTGLRAEAGQYRRAFSALGANDLFIAPGTGLVTDAYGLFNWGPYNMFKWTLMAKLRRSKVLFISVGAGPIHHRAARVLIKATLSLADYRSYRDDASRECLKGIGLRTTGDPVYPDLVFSLPEALLQQQQIRSASKRRVVGLGLMVYAGRYSTADPRPETYTAYLESLADFARWLLDHDYDIRLLLGDSDTIVIEEFRSVFEARFGDFDETRIIEEPITLVDDVLVGLASCDLVVATRFHNVVLAMLLERPVIAISFHHKCSSLMRHMDLSEYCLDIHGLDTNRLIEQFQKLEQNQEAVKRTIADGLADARTALEHQYEIVFPSRDTAASIDGTSDRRDRPRRLEKRFLDLNSRLWGRLPGRVRDQRAVRAYGAWLHSLVCRGADREMYLGTHFLRNRPALELMARLLQTKKRGEQVTIAVLGCSIGVEVYSILWTLRSRRPDLDLAVAAVDISPEVVEIAERAMYTLESSDVVRFPIFEGLTEAERGELFDWIGDEARIKPWLREGITWQVGDAADAQLIKKLGPQDLVVANNFLCHMPERSAERCLRNLAQLVSPGGHLFVTGVDLDVRTKVALELGWDPIPELRGEIHDGDLFVRSDWPWRWWGLEPLDRRQPHWETRYSAAFRVR